jgi:hypothetical protein
MTLSFSGTLPLPAYAAGAKFQPFKAGRVLDALQDPGAYANAQSLTITVSDINGGAPTDADGTFALSPGLRQTAPGTYTVSLGPTDDAATAIANDLKNLTFTSSQTSGAPVITVTANNSLNQAATDSSTRIIAAGPPTKFIVTDTLANSSYSIQGTAYTGSLSISSQYVVQIDNPALSTANLNITASGPNVFIHTGSGIDAIDVSGVGGKNILDGGTNSNFLTGCAAGSGTDTFFVDARAALSDIWDTVSNFHAGDAVTLFGITPSNKAVAWADNQGTTGATGLTLHATQSGAPQASFTLAGYTTADLSNGRLGVTFGTEADGTPYLYVAGLK